MQPTIIKSKGYPAFSLAVKVPLSRLVRRDRHATRHHHFSRGSVWACDSALQVPDRGGSHRAGQQRRSRARIIHHDFQHAAPVAGRRGLGGKKDILFSPLLDWKSRPILGRSRGCQHWHAVRGRESFWRCEAVRIRQGGWPAGNRRVSHHEEHLSECCQRVIEYMAVLSCLCVEPPEETWEKTLLPPSTLATSNQFRGVGIFSSLSNRCRDYCPLWVSRT